MTSFSTAPTVPQSFVPMHESVWWKESDMRQEAISKCVLPLTLNSHKGSSGRIGVLGGSARYTGAPYYAGLASLKVGADLAFCFCAEEACIPIKSYSPELVVIPVYKASDFDQLRQSGMTTESPSAQFLIQKMVDEVSEMLEKLHVLVIGPGLGRCPFVMEATSQIITKALSMNIPLVIDADGLFILTLQKYNRILQLQLGPSLTSDSDDDEHRSKKSPVILTPNAMEWQRLHGLEECWDHDRVVVVQKGKEDIIRFPSTSKTDHVHVHVHGSEAILHCREIGGLKRSGGIGDILAGTLGTILAWNNILVNQGVATTLDVTLACWLACSLVKRSTHVAYHQHHRAMTAPDVLHALGPTFHAMITATSTAPASDISRDDTTL